MIPVLRTVGQWLSTHPSKTYAGAWEPLRKWVANTAHTLELQPGYLGFALNEGTGALKQALAGEDILASATAQEPATLLQHLCAFGFNAGGGVNIYRNPVLESLRKFTSHTAHVFETLVAGTGAAALHPNPWFVGTTGVAAGSGLQTVRQTVLNQLG